MKTFIHVGYGKTATTALQENFFPRHTGITYLGKPFHSTRLEEFIRNLIMEDSSSYSSEPIVHYTSSLDPAKTYVISEELITSRSRDMGLMADRISKAFPSAKIIFTLREQISLIKSFYANHGRILKNVPGKAKGSFVSLEEWLSFSFDNLESSFPGRLMFYDVIKRYESVFGRQNICILLFEELIEEPMSFAAKLSDFIGVDIGESEKLICSLPKSNARDSAAEVNYAKLRSSFLPGMRLSAVIPFAPKLKKGLSTLIFGDKAVNVQLSPEWTDKIRSIYAEQNRKLEREYGICFNISKTGTQKNPEKG
jgi:hypothetical protein